MTTTKRWSGGLFFLLFLLPWPGRALAYQVCTSGGAEIKWSNPAAAYYVNTTGGPAGALTAIQAAMQAWTDVGQADFVFTYSGATTSTAYGSNDGKNIISFGTLASGTLAENTYYFNPSSGAILDSDIRFNTGYTWSTGPSSNTYDVQNIGTHEYGHSLCLVDLYNSADVDKTMYGYGAVEETKKRSLEPDDIAGIVYLYPGPDITVTPASVDFGEVQIGSLVDRTLTVANNGADNLVIGTITSPVAPFSLVAGSDFCSNQTLAPAADCTLTIRFAPAATGAFNSDLSIPSNDPDENPALVALSGSGSQNYFALATTVTGSGSVSSSDGVIDCGDTCQALYAPDTMVRLTAAPATCSFFADWTGGYCETPDSVCDLVMTGNTTEAARFEPQFPLAGFSANGPGTAAPLLRGFQDSSTCAAAWQWDVDNDGTVDSTVQNPTHLYTSPGYYTVSLTVFNSGNPDTETKTDYIYVDNADPNTAVRVAANYYNSLLEGYNAAVASGYHTIESHAVIFYDDLILDGGIAVTLKGGYDSAYSDNSFGMTTVAGSLTIRSGTVTVENIRIK